MKISILIVGLLFSGSLLAQTYNFTNAGVSGMNGPTQGDVNTAYTSTSLDGMVTVTTQGIQEWTVPVSGNYSIEAIGASGGNSTWSTPRTGGQGAHISGEFNLTAGQVIMIAVGQTGETAAIGGGGGATFVVSGGSPLIVAGAGGGASSDMDGINASTTENGTMDSQNIINGGTLGNGGNACVTSQNNGGGGAGFYTNGMDAQPTSGVNWGRGGLSFANGLIGGLPGRLDGACTGDPYGGFGGGGSGTCNTVGGGGGGGYSGGAGGPHVSNCGAPVRSGGGGGGSFNSGSNQAIAAYNTGNGAVNITLLCSPTSITPDIANLATEVGQCSANPAAPTASTNCGTTLTGTPDVSFPITTLGSTTVTWTYDAGNGTTATQTQTVNVVDTIAPVADSIALPTLNDICLLDSLPAPTATDSCVGTITGTLNVTLPYTVPGNSTITWTFDDGNGNITTQTQNVVNQSIDVSVTQTGATLTANQTSSAYQWVDCDNSFAQISGATSQSYTPTATTGNYAVIITENGGCSDTSMCYLVDYTGIQEMNSSLVSVYPNPSANGILHINCPTQINAVRVFDMQGRLMNTSFNSNDNTIDMNGAQNGNYIMEIRSDNMVFNKEIIILK